MRTLSTNTQPEDGLVKRRVGKEVLAVPCPNSVINYNAHMIGLADKKRAYYGVGRESTKFWRYLVWYILNSQSSTVTSSTRSHWHVHSHTSNTRWHTSSIASRSWGSWSAASAVERERVGGSWPPRPYIRQTWVNMTWRQWGRSWHAATAVSWSERLSEDGVSLRHGCVERATSHCVGMVVWSSTTPDTPCNSASAAVLVDWLNSSVYFSHFCFRSVQFMS